MNECVTLDLHWYYTRTNDSSVRCRAIYLVFFACDRWLGEWWSVHQCLLSYMTDNLLNYPFLIIYPQDEILIDSIDSNAYWASRHRSPCQIPVCFVSFLLLQSTSMTDVLHCYPHITVVILANMLENDTFSWIFNVQRSHTLIGLPRKGIMCFFVNETQTSIWTMCIQTGNIFLHFNDCEEQWEWTTSICWQHNECLYSKHSFNVTCNTPEWHVKWNSIMRENEM
jgi:hypothetical protein